MGRSWRDKPIKERQIEIQKHNRGSHRRMDPYVRAKSKSWEQDY